MTHWRCPKIFLQLIFFNFSDEEKLKRLRNHFLVSSSSSELCSQRPVQIGRGAITYTLSSLCSSCFVVFSSLLLCPLLKSCLDEKLKENISPFEPIQWGTLSFFSFSFAKPTLSHCSFRFLSLSIYLNLYFRLLLYIYDITSLTAPICL